MRINAREYINATFDTPEALEIYLATIEPSMPLDVKIHKLVYGEMPKKMPLYSRSGGEIFELLDYFVNTEEYTTAKIESSYWHGHFCHISMSDNIQWVYTNTSNGLYEYWCELEHSGYSNSSMQMAICRAILRVKLGYEFYKKPLFDTAELKGIEKPYMLLGLDFAKRYDISYDEFVEKAMKAYLESIQDEDNY